MMSKFMEWVDARFPATKMWEDGVKSSVRK